MALVSNAAASREEELRRLMPPPAARPPSAATAPKPKPAIVLDEDTYTQQLGAIIERDYFPELPKMANQLEWLRAVNSGDIREMQRAQRNIARRRAAAAAAATTPALGGETPGGALFTAPGTSVRGAGWATATPGTARLGTPAMTPMVGAAAAGESAAGAAAGAAGGVGPAGVATAESGAVDLNLDTFLSRYTSEDNASFQAILEEDNRRKRAKVKHHLERPDPRDPETRQLLLEGPKDRPSDEFGSSGQAPMTLLPAPEPVINSLFYDSSQRPLVPYSAKELAEQALGPPKAINKAGTRIKEAALEAPQALAPAAAAAVAAAAVAAAGGSAEESAAAAALAAAEAAGVPLGAPMPGGGTVGYAAMATPALEEVLATPLMTWGDIESTPLRLGADDMPVALDVEALVGGPSFKVQGLTEREQAAHRLAAAKAGSGSAASRATTARGSTPLLTALRRAATGGGTGTTPRAGGATPLAVPLSPAARQLAANIKAGGVTPRAGGGATAAAFAGRSGGGGSHRGGHGHYNHHRGGGHYGRDGARGGGGGGGGGGTAVNNAAAAAAAATAARSAALGSGELDKQLRASYRSGSALATSGAHGGTPSAASGLGRIHTPGGAAAAGAAHGGLSKAGTMSAAAATAAAAGGRRTPVVVGAKRPPARTGSGVAPPAPGAPPPPPATQPPSSHPSSVTDDLLKL